MGATNRQPSAPAIDYAGLAKTDIVGYVKAVYASPNYQGLTDEGKKSVRDYMYSTDVVPFYKNQGQPVPPRSILEPNGTSEPEPTDANYKKFLTKGGLIGLAKSAAGTANTFLGLSQLPLQLVHSLLTLGDRGRVEEVKGPSKDVEGAIHGLDIAKLNITNMKENAQNFYDDAFGEPTNTKERLSEMAGELGGQLPAFLLANKVLGALGNVSKLQEGAAAVPLFVKNLPNSVRYIAASQTIQKSLYAALEGGLSASLTDNPEDAGSWAAFGAVLPPAWATIKKPFTMLLARDGALGVGKVFESALNTAKQAKGARPVPKSDTEAASSLLASKLDEGASAVKEGKDFSEISPEQQVTVAQKVQQELHKTISDVSEDDVAELAGTEHEVASSVSPLAKQTDDEISSIATQAGVPTTKEAVAKKAAKDVQRATITEKVKSAPITETVPEADHTLVAQLDAVKAGTKRGMVISKEQVKSLGAIPDELGVQSFSDGQAVIFNSKAIPVNKVKELKLKNRINEVVDYPVSKDEVAQAVKNGEEPVTIIAKDAVTGAEKETVAASSSSAVETVEAVQKHFPEAEVTVGGPEDAAKAVKERLIQNIKHGAMNQIQAEAYGIMLNKQMEPSAKAIAEVEAGIKAWKEAGLPDAELQSLLREIEAKKIQVLDQARASAKAAPIPEPAPAAPEAVAAKPKEVPMELIKAREDAKAAAKDLANETNMVNKVTIMERLNKALEVKNKLEAKYGIKDEVPVAAEAPVSQIEKPTVKAAKKAKAKSEEPADRNVASGLAVKIEIRKSGLSENEAYAIIKKYGYSSTKDIPEGPEAEAILEEIRAAALKKTPFYRMDGNADILTENPESQASRDAGKVILKPTKVLNMDTGFDPVFARHVNEDFPSLNASPMAPQKAFQAVVEHLKGQDKDIGDWLKDKGYDLIHQGTEDGQIVEVLNKDVVKTIAINKAEKMADAAVATGATSIEQARASVKVAKDVEAELTRLAQDAIAKGEVKVQKFDVNGKPKKNMGMEQSIEKFSAPAKTWNLDFELRKYKDNHYVVVNNKVARMLKDIAGSNNSKYDTFGGMYVPNTKQLAIDMRGKANDLLAERGQEWQKLHDAMWEASDFVDSLSAKTQRYDVAFVNKDYFNRGTIKHEWAHGFQNQFQLDWVQYDDLFDSIPAEAYATLVEKGYNGHRASFVNEVLSRISAGQHWNIGMTDTSGAKFLDSYFSMVKEKFGTDALSDYPSTTPLTRKIKGLHEPNTKDWSAKFGWKEK